MLFVMVRILDVGGTVDGACCQGQLCGTQLMELIG